LTMREPKRVVVIPSLTRNPLITKLIWIPAFAGMTTSQAF
jgi:hypothetical protein